jgi:hypothetical protein
VFMNSLMETKWKAGKRPKLFPIEYMRADRWSGSKVETRSEAWCGESVVYPVNTLGWLRLSSAAQIQLD